MILCSRNANTLENFELCPASLRIKGMPINITITSHFWSTVFGKN